MLGIILSKFFLMDNGNWIYVLIICIAFIFLFILVYAYAYITKDYNSKHNARRKLSLILKSSSVASIVSLLVGIVVSLFPMAKVLTLPSYYNDVVVSGVVCDYIKNSPTSKSFLIKDVSIVCNDETYSSDYKITVYSNPMLDIELGNRVMFVSTIDKYLYTDSNGFNNLVNDIGYSTFVNVSDIVVDKGDIELKDVIKNKMRTILDSHLSEDNADISYAILFGGSKSVNNEIKEMFSYAGISHILAVSGLHVGVIFSFIWKLLSLIKKPTNRKKREYPKLVIFGLIILFYAYMCNFAVSVCRAGIMIFIYSLCNCLQIEYDSLSSLSLAGVVILLVNPMLLFDLSFQLSFMSIFAIIALAPTLNRFFLKIKMPKFLASTLAVSLAVNIALLPLSVNAFSKVSLIGIITNIFVLPIFEVLYILLFFVMIIALILPFMGVFLWLPNLFLHLIKVVVNYANEISFGVVRAFNVGFLVVLFMSIFILIIHFLMVKKRYKIFACGIVAMVVGLLGIYFYLPEDYSYNNLIISHQNDTNITFVINNNCTTMIGSNISEVECLAICKKLRLHKIDNIIAYDFKLNNLNELKEIVDENSVQNIYIPNQFNYNNVDYGDNYISFDEDIIVNNVMYKVYYYLGDIIAIQFNLKGVGNILIPSIDNNKQDNIYLSNECDKFDYLLLAKNNMIEGFGEDAEIIYFDNQDLIRINS